MIKYALRCAKEHRFESWFSSGADYDRLAAAGLLACPDCGDASIDKDIMAPRLSGTSPDAAPQGASPTPLAAAPTGTDVQPHALAELRRWVEANSEDVGKNFATEARAIHDGEAVSRPIYGEARIDEARKLIEDGIPVAPLPIPKRRQN